MANRRMISKKVIDTDNFLDMPDSAQSLYFHLLMRADDDGFISNPKTIMRMLAKTDDDIKLLKAKGYLIPFESGVCVIKHWRVHNYIQKDRYQETFHKYEKSFLEVDESKNSEYVMKETPSERRLLDENTVCTQDGHNLDTECIHDVSNPVTQVRLEKELELELEKEKDTSEIRDPDNHSGKSSKKSNKKYTEDHMKLAEFLWKRILDNNPKAKKPDLEKWANTFRLMSERDDRDLYDMQNVIDYATKDPFWMVNILSADKLRKQFDRLYMQMNQQKGGGEKNEVSSGLDAELSKLLRDYDKYTESEREMLREMFGD